ncbi:MAG TPA: hypothetical protein VGM18_02215 [Candidatus Sulfotelmatobacter sp.]|jgi:hypothetical protein
MNACDYTGSELRTLNHGRYCVLEEALILARANEFAVTLDQGNSPHDFAFRHWRIRGSHRIPAGHDFESWSVAWGDRATHNSMYYESPVAAVQDDVAF